MHEALLFIYFIVTTHNPDTNFDTMRIRVGVRFLLAKGL